VPGAGASVRFTGTAASVRVTGSGIGGFTSQDLPIVVKLSRDGRRVARTMVALELRCDSGDRFWIPDEYENLRISRRGRFSDSFVLPPTPNGGGETLAVTSSLSGRANAARTIVSGTWRMTATFHDTSSGVDDVCRSGKVSFKVSR
jgi:hypothetical protein